MVLRTPFFDHTLYADLSRAIGRVPCGDVFKAELVQRSHSMKLLHLIFVGRVSSVQYAKTKSQPGSFSRLALSIKVLMYGGPVFSAPSLFWPTGSLRS